MPVIIVKLYKSCPNTARIPNTQATCGPLGRFVLPVMLSGNFQI